MEFISSYILLSDLNMEVSKESITRLLQSIQASYSESSLDLFLEKIEGKSISEVLAAGSDLMKSKMASAAPAASSASTNASAPKVEVEAVESSESVLDFF